MSNQVVVTMPTGSRVTGQTESYGAVATALANLIVEGPNMVEVLFAWESEAPSPVYLFKTWVQRG